jgi:PAS domain S-box-containing protein
MEKARILIVEDQDIFAVDLKNRLAALGHAVPAVVAYGEEAVAKAEELRPDLVLMNIALKGEMDGMQAAEQIRQQFGLPVIYLTVPSDEETLGRAGLTEPYGYVFKPFEDRELNVAIEITLYKHRMERKLKESERRLTATLERIGDSEAHYRNLFEESPAALWEEDFSAVKQYLDDLRAKGIVDLKAYFGEHPGEVSKAMSRIRIIDVNHAGVKLYRAETKDDFFSNIHRIFGDPQPMFVEELVAMADGRTEFVGEGINFDVTDNRIDIELRWSVMPGYEQSLSKVIVTIVDITKRKQAEAALKESEARYRQLFEQASVAAEQFLRTPDWREGIQEVLGGLGWAAGVSRVYVFENHSDESGEVLSSRRFEWVVPGVTPQLDNPDLQAVPLKTAGFGRWINILGQGQVLHGLVRDFPASERALLEPQDIRSIVVVPITVGHEWWGFIGFDECRVEREWSAVERDALKAAADTLGAAIHRQRAEAALNHRVKLDELIANISSRFITIAPEVVDDEILRALQSLSEFMNVEHGFVARLVDGDTALMNTHQWTAPGIDLQLGGMKIPVEQLAWIVSRLRRLETVHIPRVADLSAEAQSLKDILLARNIRSAIRVPLSLGGAPLGFLALNAVQTEKTWSEEEIMALKLAGEIFVGALQRKKAEEALRASEARYHLVFDKMIDGFAIHEMVMDAQGELCDYRWLAVNPAFERLTQLTAAEVVGKRALEVLPSLDPEWLKQYGELARTGRPAHFEKYIPALGKTFDVTAFPTEPGQFVTVFVDITDRKQAEAALEQANLVIENSPVVLFRWSLDVEGGWPVEFVTNNINQFGYTAEEILSGQVTYVQMIYPDDLPRVIAEEEACLAQNVGVWQTEYRLVTKDRRVVWVEDHTLVERDEHGQAIRTQGTITDITKRKQAEEALRQSEVRYRRLFESSPVSLWEEDFSEVRRRVDQLRQQGVADFDLFFKQHPELVAEYLNCIKITDVNRATLELYRAFTKNELLGNLGTVFRGDSHETFRSELVTIAEGKTTFEGEGINYTLRGGKLNVLLRWAIASENRDDWSKVLVSVEDITERRKAEEALREANTELEMALFKANQLAIAAEEASQLKSQILANTSHELRTPLTAILGSLSVVLEGLCDAEEEKIEFINTAYTAARSLLALINDLLDLAKIESGRMDVDLQPVNIASIFSEVRDLTALHAHKKNLTLDIRLPENPELAVRADVTKLQQIVLNLVGNAIKFTERGEVRVSAAADGDYVRINVQDTGIGVALDKQKKLFHPFVQGDGSTTRKYGGTGLGLSISRQLARLMDGELTLSSAGEGHGSTFTLILPKAETAY